MNFSNIIERDANPENFTKIIASSETSEDLCRRMFGYLSSVISLQMGTLYMEDKLGGTLQLISSYAKDSRIVQNTLNIRNSLTGECYTKKQERSISFETNLAQCELHLIPLLYQDDAIGIIELYCAQPLSPKEKGWLDGVLPLFSVNFKIRFDAEAQIHLKEIFFNSIFDLTSEAMVIIDRDFSVLKYNHVFQSLFPSISINRNLGRYFEEEEEEEEEEEVAYLNALKSDFDIKETSIIKRKGRFYRVNARHIHYKDDSDILLVLSDQTDLLEAEAFIEENVIFTQTNKRGIITRASLAFCEISGYEKEELIGKPHNIVRHPDMPSSVFRDMWETLSRGETFHAKIKNRHKEGGYYWVDSVVSPIIHDNTIAGYRSIRHDITNEHDLEERLGQ